MQTVQKVEPSESTKKLWNRTIKENLQKTYWTIYPKLKLLEPIRDSLELKFIL